MRLVVLRRPRQAWLPSAARAAAVGDFQERCHSLAAFQAAWINGSA
jgi:hypothetical protein